MGEVAPTVEAHALSLFSKQTIMDETETLRDQFHFVPMKGKVFL